MANNSVPILMAVMIFICGLSGCLDDSSQELEVEVTNLKETNDELTGLINNSTMELEEFQFLLSNANNSIISLENILSQLSNDAEQRNQTIQTLEVEIQLLQLQNQIHQQNIRLQSMEYNNSEQDINDEIGILQSLLDEANEVISDYLIVDTSSTGSPFNPLLFEQYDPNGTYMNHANWNGGLWDRVTFDDKGIPLVQYHDGLKYVPTTAFHWGLVSISKWITTGNQSNFDNAMEIAIWAVENQSETGGWGWFFNHSFHGGDLGEMYSGWYGGMTQGLSHVFPYQDVCRDRESNIQRCSSQCNSITLNSSR
jgi:hypothetical protein